MLADYKSFLLDRSSTGTNLLLYRKLNLLAVLRLGLNLKGLACRHCEWLHELLWWYRNCLLDRLYDRLLS